MKCDVKSYTYVIYYQRVFEGYWYQLTMLPCDHHMLPCDHQMLPCDHQMQPCDHQTLSCVRNFGPCAK